MTGNRATGHTTREEARRERHAHYRDDMARYAISCGGTAWRECDVCKRNTRHVAGKCVDCNDPDYRELPY